MNAGLISKSLLISISDYMPDASGNRIDLNGPNNDSKDVSLALFSSQENGSSKNILRFFKKLFGHKKTVRSKDHVRLTDSDADKESFLKALKNFCGSIANGEYGLFYFSGHGTQILDQRGDEHDGLTECLCPYDTMVGNLVTDDEIRLIINENLKPDAKILMILDCCHAAGQSRSIEKPKGIDLTIPVKKNFTYDERMHENVLLWAACGENEVAWERVYGGKPRGAFTRAIIPYIFAMAKGVRVDFESVHVDVVKQLHDVTKTNNQGSQMPHMESRGPISDFWQ